MVARRLLMVVNPRGGARRGLAILEYVQPAFAATGIDVDVRITEYRGHAVELARSLDLSAYEGFCLIGGDGTIHEVVNGLMQRDQPVRIPIGIIPGGTGNAVSLHLGCNSPRDAIERIVAGRRQPVDVARLIMSSHTEYCVNIIGWGCVVDINRTAERLRLLGPPRYSLAALWHIWHAHRRPLKVTLDTDVIEDEFLFVAACNTRFTGKGMQLAPGAHLDDGKIDLVMVRRATRWQLLNLFRRVYNGSHVALSCVEYRQTRSFRLESPSQDTLLVDGELTGTTPASVDVLHAALEFFA